MMKLAVTLAAALLTACGSALPASLASPQDPVAAVLARLADTHGVAGDRP